MQPAVISVSDFLGLLNMALRAVPTEGMVIEGEVADFKISQGKWVNFDLKDEKAEAKISCFMTTYQLKVPLASGMKVHVRGYAKVFERFGKLSLNVEEVELVGEGALAKAYAMLKEKLAAEGLFDVSRKRSIPQIPERIGLITSKEAAAYGDFLRILGNRWGGVTVLHAPVHVQGQFAVPEILAAFAQFNAMAPEERPDVLVLTRGGGSLEDLHAFNDEQVARAVFGSAVPVVVGVGHERDESLCDFVADVRASTPSNAAERVVPDRRDVLRTIVYSLDTMQHRVEYRLERCQQRVDRSVDVLDKFMTGKIAEITKVRERFGHAFDRFRLSLLATIDRINAREQFLRSMDPLRVLARGYAVVRAQGRVVRDPAELAAGERITVQLQRGTADARVEKDTLF